jgi:hypothetical protein
MLFLHRLIHRSSGQLGAGHGVEGFGSVIEVAAGALTGLCATDLPAWVPVFAASGRGEPAGDGYILNMFAMSAMYCAACCRPPGGSPVARCAAGRASPLRGAVRGSWAG